MITKYLLIKLLSFVFFVFSIGIVKAQTAVDYYSIGGIVKDSRSKKAIEYVNVSAKGTNIGTVTNADGEFVLKLYDSLFVKEIELSCIGYFNVKINISKNMEQNQTYYITPQIYTINNAEVLGWKTPRDLVELAMKKVNENYSMKPNMLTGFYRETIQKRRSYICISEAVIQVYKTAYNHNADNDRSQVIKGRKLVSPKKNDTLDVKFLGGPNILIFLDVVKNPDILLSKDYLYCYSYTMGEATSIDERLHYVVNFKPQVILDYPLYSGTLYIDKETFVFTRAELSMDMSDRAKVIKDILVSKPQGLRFVPEEITTVVTYKQLSGKTRLNYIRNEIRFKCDWRRKLFATNYTIINEVVITDIEENNVTQIPTKSMFSARKSLSQEVTAYYDENFWGAYNIIEPTESLENAVNKLKKRQK